MLAIGFPKPVLNGLRRQRRRGLVVLSEPAFEDVGFFCERRLHLAHLGATFELFLNQVHRGGASWRPRPCRLAPKRPISEDIRFANQEPPPLVTSSIPQQIIRAPMPKRFLNTGIRVKVEIVAKQGIERGAGKRIVDSTPRELNTWHSLSSFVPHSNNFHLIGGNTPKQFIVRGLPKRHVTVPWWQGRSLRLVQ